jgi:hypothetical protein
MGLDAKIEILLPFTYTFKLHQTITSTFAYPYIKGIRSSNIKGKNFACPHFCGEIITLP